jgi:hypothetical protein
MSFRSASGGRQLGGIKVVLRYECKSFPPQVEDAETLASRAICERPRSAGHTLVPDA